MTFTHPAPVLRAVAAALHCGVGEIESWIESNLGEPVARHSSPEERLAAVRCALRVPEAESVIGEAERAAQQAKKGAG